jgi:hypothetical protein
LSDLKEIPFNPKHQHFVLELTSSLNETLATKSLARKQLVKHIKENTQCKVIGIEIVQSEVMCEHWQKVKKVVTGLSGIRAQGYEGWKESEGWDQVINIQGSWRLSDEIEDYKYGML